MDRKENSMRHLVILAFWITIGAGCHKDVDPDCIENQATVACVR
jgi:hypothetical protein